MSQALLVIVLTSGCSAVVMRPAPKHPVSEPECTGSRVAPVVDAAITGTLIWFAVGYSADDPYQDGPVGIRMGDVPKVALATGALFAFSSVAGFITAHDCDKAHETWIAQGSAPPPPPPPRRPLAPLVERVASTSPEAARLTREAHAAAFADDCRPVLANGPRVRYLDAEYYEKVFVVDVAIARCQAAIRASSAR